MDDIERGAVEGTEVRAPAPPGRERRTTADRKRDAVLRGEPRELVARELAVTAAALGTRRDASLEAGEDFADRKDDGCPDLDGSTTAPGAW